MAFPIISREFQVACVEKFLDQLRRSSLGAICTACHNGAPGNDFVPRGNLCADCSLSERTGEIPHVLSTLTLVERLLITQRFTAAYRISLLCDTPVLPVKYNVDLQMLDAAEADGIFCSILPLSNSSLEKLITLNVVGTLPIPEAALPRCLRVRRDKVLDALNWLVLNNPVYAEVSICENHLQALPENGFHEHFCRRLKLSRDICIPAIPRYLPHFDVTFADRHISEMFPCLFPFASSLFTSHDEESVRRAAIRCFEIHSRFRTDKAFTFAVFKYILSYRYNILLSDRHPSSTGYELGPIVQATIGLVDRLTGMDFLKSGLRSEIRGCIAVMGPPAAFISLRGRKGTVLTNDEMDLNVNDMVGKFPFRFYGPDVTPFEATAALEKTWEAFMSSMLGWGISDRQRMATGFLGDVDAFVANVCTESSGNLALNVLVWLEEDTQNLARSGPMLQSALGLYCDIHVVSESPESQESHVLPFMHLMTKSSRPPHLFTNRASHLLKAYSEPSNYIVGRIIEHCAASVIFDGELSQTEMTQVILNAGNTHSSHTFVDLSWDALVGTVKNHFHLQGPGRLTNEPNEPVDAYRSRDAEWDNLSLWQFTLRRFPGPTQAITLPRVIGQWTPSRVHERPLYWASMLALWKPWRVISELQHPELSFQDRFDYFLIRADYADQQEWAKFQNMLYFPL